ncbi:hypothetical protein, partial [Corynebacterium minutissimum]|uniref:hypothetical protein n=1 Tax=Corynebacterium minutissimum TaxID=38301 RepID=UPI001EF175AD
AQPKSNPPNKHCSNIYHQLTKRLPRGDPDKYTHTPNKQQIAWLVLIFNSTPGDEFSDFLVVTG